MRSAICTRCRDAERVTGSYCRECKRQQDKEDYARHREERMARSRAYYQENREQALATGRRWKEANREALREWGARWRAENPEKKAAAHRRHALRRMYGLALEEYERMVEAQDGLCLICGQSPELLPRENILQVDHCHETGKIRGLLCGPCNRGLGAFRDDPTRLILAIAYLEGIE